jgi:hypothetical protein
LISIKVDIVLSDLTNKPMTPLKFLNLITTPLAFAAAAMCYGTVAQQFGFSHAPTIILMACIAVSFLVRRLFYL